MNYLILFSSYNEFCIAIILSLNGLYEQIELFIANPNIWTCGEIKTIIGKASAGF